MDPVIIAKDLYKCYAGFAPVLRGVNIQVEQGEMVAIMGPSGCGKSTMLHVLGLLHAPDSGSLEILKTNVLALGREQTAAFRRGNLGFVMQSSNLFEHSTVFENVEFPLIYENVPPQERWERVIRALDLVRLSARVHYRGNRLSGGEQQRVAIARAMVNNPRILMADEPTGALDARTSRLIMENFRRLCHFGGVAMVMVTHDPKMAEYCDSVYTLEEGVLVAKKHEVASFAAAGNENFLKPPEPVVRGALVAGRFPDPASPSVLEFARRLHSQGLLARIYAMSQRGFLGNADGYSLPLAVRSIGFWQGLKALVSLFKRARGSQSLWGLWRQLPASVPFRGLGARLKNFARGGLLARWGLEDNIEFFYAAGALGEATSAWVASRLLRVPFAFSVSAADLARQGHDWRLKARDAAFVACPTMAIKNALAGALPDIPEKKIILLRESLPNAAEEEQPDAAMPGQPGAPVAILAMAAPGRDLDALLGACAVLKKRGVNFRLLLSGARTWRGRWRVFGAGLRRQTVFHGAAGDSLEALYKASDIFVAFRPAGAGGDLALPVSICEAMAHGLGLVVCGSGKGIEEAVRNGRNALAVPARDVPALAAALEKLASDVALREKIGGNARLDIRKLLDIQAGSQLLADMLKSAALAARARPGRDSEVSNKPKV